MGTSLTGLTPATTYDALIKVGDNGPLSATAKVLSDGLGNDSILALSTTSVGIGTSSPSTTLHLDAAGGATIRLQRTSASANRFDVGTDGTNMEFNVRDTGAFTFGGGNVGIGTSSPNAKLAIKVSNGSTNAAFINDTPTTAGTEVSYLSYFGTDNGGTMFATPLAQIGAISKNGGVAFGDLVFRTTPASGATAERVRILADGGLTFNGDTAAANALDDYEEGTWTMGVSFGGGSTGVTYVYNTGTYTKIGRQVTVNGYLALSSKGSSTGTAKITGLPFTVGNTTGNLAAASLRFDTITFTNQFQGYGGDNTTTISLEEITILGAVTVLADTDFSNSSSVILSLTYFV